MIDKLIATTLSAALLVTAPGLGCWNAVAQVVAPTVTGAGVSAAPSGAVAGAVPTSLPGGSHAPAALRLTPSALAPTTMLKVGAPHAPAAAGRLQLGGAAASPVVAGASRIAGPAAQAVGNGPAAYPVAAASQVVPEGLAGRLASPVLKLLADPKTISLSAVEIGRMSGGQARDAAARQMDRVLGVNAAPESGSVVAGVDAGVRANALRQAPLGTGGDFVPSSSRVPVSPVRPGEPSPNRGGNRFVKLLGSMAWIAGGAAIAIGAQAAAVALAPAMFGFIPGAALWAVMSGVVIAPAALYFRYRMGLRDSERLKGPKRLFDVSLGLLAGATFVALPGILTGAVFASPAVAIPIGVIGVGTLLSMIGGESHLKTGLLALGSTALLTASAAAIGPMTIGAVFGLVAMPVLTTLSFFLGRIVESAETGRPFSIPGSMQPIRFPIYTWVMTGVVFALLTGYSPFWVNAAFGAWMFLGSSKLFNYAYLGALGLALFSGLQAPVTFLVIAFAPERAAVWAEKLLGKMLPAGRPAPSSAAPVKSEPVSLTAKAWPKYHYAIQTGIYLATLFGFGWFMGASIVGVGSIITNTLIASALAFIPLIFAKKMIKAMMKAEPLDEARNPVVFRIVRRQWEKANAARVKAGKKAWPLPELVRVPMPVPNAFATGIWPSKALIGVTDIFSEMTLEPEILRSGLIRMLDRVEPHGKPFQAFRNGIGKSIPGIAADAGPQAVIGAVRNASREQLEALGERIMAGVIGHEINHILHRDMILGAIAGAQSSGIAFASYGVLWAVGHARYLARKAIDYVRGRSTEPRRDDGGTKEEGTRNLEGGIRPEAVDPVSTGLAIKTIAGLVKVFVALWAPVVAQMLQMASGRTREAHADEGGAILSEDPAALALGLGLLMSWRPNAGFRFDRRRLPFIAATQQLFTVNPGEQLLEAGVLESSERFQGRPVEKKDNAFLNLFITHPDTTERIEKLWDMTQAMDAKHGPRGGGGGGGGGSRSAADGTRNLSADDPGGGLSRRHPGSLRHSHGDESYAAVDADTDEGLRLPGLDARLSPVVDVLRSEIGSSPAKRRRLGHLVAALDRHLAAEGTVRFTGLALSGQMVAAHYEPSTKAIYLNQMLRRSNPKLQAALLAAQLQEVSDHQEGRTAATKEAAARQVLALDAFLDGTDMRAMAETIDINNPLEAQLFESQIEQRQWAAAGSGAFEQVFSELETVPMMLQKAQDQVSLLKRQQADLADELGLVRTGLEGPIGVAGLAHQERVLAERSRILEGSVSLAVAQLEMLERESVASGGKLETPLSAGVQPADVDPSSWKLVPVKQKPAVDPRLAEPVALIRNTIAASSDPRIRALAPVVGALERLTAAGGRVALAPSGDDAVAYFSPVTLDLVVGTQFANTDPALVAAMMVHELTHALDYFEGRPLTRETEKNAFTNEAIFIGAFDPRKIAARLDVRNPTEQAAYQLIYHARARYVEGNTSLESMISEAYRKLFGAHFEGLQTAGQLLDETRRSKLAPLIEVRGQLEQRAELLAAAAAKGDPGRRAQLAAVQRTIALTEAHIRLFERQVEQLETIGPDADPAPPGPKGGAAGGFSGGTRQRPMSIMPKGFGPKLGLTHLESNLLPPSLAPPPPRAPDPGEAGGGGLLRRAWRRATSLLRVLPEEGRNREFWKFVGLQALLTVGQSFHYTALPGLIAPRPEDSSRLGANRAVNWGAQAFSNLATGPLVDRTSARAVLVGTHLGRAVLMLAVPALFFGLGTSSFIGAFLAVIALHGFLQATSITGGTVAYSRILGPDAAHYNRANAVFNIVVSAAGVLAPLAAGAFIGALGAGLSTPGAGNALSYAVYGVVLALATVGFWRLSPPRDPVLQARRDLEGKLRESPPSGPRVRGVAAREEQGRSVLLVEVQGDPAESRGVPERFADYEVRVVPQRRVLKELAEGFKILWSIRFLRYTFLFSGLNYLVADSLIFTALPRYIATLPETGGLSAVAGVPLLGGLVSALTSKAGVFGLYLASGSLGMAIASAWLALRKPKEKAEPEVVSPGKLDRQDRAGWWTGLLFGLAALLYWPVFFSTSLWTSVGAMLLLSTLQGFAAVVWPGLYQRALMEQKPHDMGKAYAALYFYQLALSVLGVLLFGWLMAVLPGSTAFWVVGLTMTAVALLQIAEIFVVFPSTRAKK
ncbi:MAG: MFS transporter [Elusimicrobia bacterium]|nr:MFS transporter [Elusimicrobiota bacterium]